MPEATAITAATPGISDWRAIGDWAPPCGGGLWAWTGCTPGVPRLGVGGGGGAAPGLRSAVSATITVVTPGMARTAASASARTDSQARASAASTLIEKNTLPSAALIALSTLALVSATPRGDLILARLSRTCCCVTLKAHLLNRA
ncbi:hypothetical protein ACVW0J_007183 [Bradyrhizobium sp. i1.7.7]